nr:hypothetical protein [Tanacetum cinerariifolium]
MAQQQQQQQRDVPQDQLCPPNKRFDLMDANKKFDLVNPQCPNKSKILANILNNHPLRLCVEASALVSWIYMSHLWHTLKMDESRESSSQRKLTVIRFCVTRRPNPETLIPIAAEVDITNLNKATQISVAIQRSLEDLEAQQNVEKVKEHMMDEELEQLLEGIKNVDEDAFMDDVLNSQEDPNTKIELRSNKESLEAEKVADMMIIQDDEVGEESARDEFELRRREKGKGIEETREACPVEGMVEDKKMQVTLHKVDQHLHTLCLSQRKRKQGVRLTFVAFGMDVLKSTLKRIGVNGTPAIEEVNIFKDKTIIQFLNSKAVRPMNVALLENQFQMLMVNMFWLTLLPFYEHKCGLVAATVISPDCQG